MKKLKIWSWYISSFLKKHSRLILLSSSFGVIVAVFSIWILPYIPRPNPVIKVGFVGQYRRNKMPDYITEKVGQGLTAILEDGTAVPAIAYDWSITEDGTIYTFFLRDDIFWQDGTEIKAQDFDYQFEGVEKKALDDHTLQFVLKDPYSPFLTLVSRPVLKNGIYGTGLYTINGITERSGYLNQVTLESKKEKIYIKFYPNLPNTLLAFKLGEIDQITEIYTDPFMEQTDWQESLVVTKTQDTQQYIGLFLNNRQNIGEKANPLFDKTFRQALAYATPKPEDSTRATGPISVTSWAYNPDVKPYEYEPQRARELLEKSLGSLERADEITLTISTTQTFLELGEEIARAWHEDLGINAEVSIISTIPSEFDILLLSQEIPLDPDQYAQWHSTQPQNLIHFENVRIDKVLEDARIEHNLESRKEYYLDFQRFFTEESPVIFISYPEVYTIKRKSITKPFIRTILNFGNAPLG
jgi:peptide/nickel transport system substrate-binding protein